MDGREGAVHQGTGETPKGTGRCRGKDEDHTEVRETHSPGIRVGMQGS